MNSKPSSHPHNDVLFEKLLSQERVIQSAALPAEQTPTCLDLFDKWATCFALVPQFRNVYRYGTFNDCQPKLDDWKYCLSLKGIDKAQRREAWIERKSREMARRRMPGGSTSEEIWEMRTDPVIAPEWVDPAFAATGNQEQQQQSSATSKKTT